MPVISPAAVCADVDGAPAHPHATARQMAGNLLRGIGQQL
jgi:hypothetical protein